MSSGVAAKMAPSAESWNGDAISRCAAKASVAGEVAGREIKAHEREAAGRP